MLTGHRRAEQLRVPDEGADPQLIVLDRNPGQPSIPLMSIRVSGWASRSFIIGIRLWPPASTRDSGPNRASSSSACSTLVALSYSTCDGTCIDPPGTARHEQDKQ